ncbi:hypothetical protein OSTOST_02502 [Ostertagia ostertagi]
MVAKDDDKSTAVAVMNINQEKRKRAESIDRYGDEPPCRFTIPDDVERSHYANFSPLYKSMEDFLLRHKHRRGNEKAYLVAEKNVRRMFQNAFASKAAKLEKERKKKGESFTSLQDEAESATVDDSSERFQFVGIGDDIKKILESPKKFFDAPKNCSPSLKYTDGGWWYRRTRPRIYPTVVVAEFIEKRDVEKDCNEDVNVYRLSKTLTIRNSGVFVDDGLYYNVPGAQQNCGHSNSIVLRNKDQEPNIMALIQNDEVVRKFFAPLLKDARKH